MIDSKSLVMAYELYFYTTVDEKLHVNMGLLPNLCNPSEGIRGDALS